MAASGSTQKLAAVTFRTLPSSRKEWRSRWEMLDLVAYPARGGGDVDGEIVSGHSTNMGNGWPTILKPQGTQFSRRLQERTAFWLAVGLASIDALQFILPKAMAGRASVGMTGQNALRIQRVSLCFSITFAPVSCANSWAMEFPLLMLTNGIGSFLPFLKSKNT